MNIPPDKETKLSHSAGSTSHAFVLPFPSRNLQDVMVNILLIGANVKNKGAEVIALAAIRKFSERFREARFTVASVAHPARTTRSADLSLT